AVSDPGVKRREWPRQSSVTHVEIPITRVVDGGSGDEAALGRECETRGRQMARRHLEPVSTELSRHAAEVLNEVDEPSVVEAVSRSRVARVGESKLCRQFDSLEPRF